jgi:hypothetical protein
MKAICIAMVLAGVSTPALAREAHHHKHVRHRHALVTDAWQPFGGATVVPERWDARARAPGIGLDASPSQGAYAEMVARHAAANGVPVSLVHRVIMRESRYNPRAISQGNYGIMQIRLSTARAMGYTGSASGLLDPEVNMTYAVKYLAGAYKTAGGSEGGAVANYARGYYRACDLPVDTHHLFVFQRSSRSAWSLARESRSSASTCSQNCSISNV